MCGRGLRVGIILDFCPPPTRLLKFSTDMIPDFIPPPLRTLCRMIITLWGGALVPCRWHGTVNPPELPLRN